MRRVVVAPHMDDESLGCGGLLAKYADECQVVVLADSGPVRRAEHEKALAILGVASSTCLGFADGRLANDSVAVVTALDRFLCEAQPDEVYLPFPSLHQDHIATYEAGMRASRVSMTEGHWFPRGVYIYDIAAYDVNLYPTDLRWNVFESLTEDHIDRKAAACQAYESELPSGIHPIKSVKEIAGAIGNMRLVPFAEQFALVRDVRP